MKNNLFTVLVILALLGCASQAPLKDTKMYTIIYPPLVEEGNTGVLIELVYEAFKSQGVIVSIEILPLKEAMDRSEKEEILMIGTRLIQHDKKYPTYYEEIYSGKGYLISIKNNNDNDLIGVFDGATDEIDYVVSNGLKHVKYSSFQQGLELLYRGDIGEMFCFDVNCEKIKISNPSISFDMTKIYDLPFDVVFYGEDIPVDKINEMLAFKRGLQEIINSGKYFDIFDKYRVNDALYKMSLDKLLNVTL